MRKTTYPSNVHKQPTPVLSSPVGVVSRPQGKAPVAPQPSVTGSGVPDRVPARPSERPNPAPGSFKKIGEALNH
jgi:hypothetical protein